MLSAQRSTLVPSVSPFPSTSTFELPRARLSDKIESVQKGDREAYCRLAEQFVVHPYHMGTPLMREHRQDLVDEDGYEKARHEYYKLYETGRT
jgi:hypothetical protein